MKQTLRDLAGKLSCHFVGDGSATVTHVSSLQSAGTGSLIFIDNPKHLQSALASPAAAIIAGDFAATNSGKPVLISSQPRLAFARAAKFLGDSVNVSPGIHASAVVSPTAQLGKDVAVGAHTVVGDNAKIGNQVAIASGCAIGNRVEIGVGCRVDANVTIYPGTKLGNRVVIQAGAVLGSEGFGYVRDMQTGRYEQFPQVGSLIIEDNVEIGANSTIDRGALDETRIRRGTKIDNLVHIGHNCQVGHDVVIAAQTGLSGSATVEDNVIIGGQVGIADHVRIEEGAVLGAQSGIPSKKIIRGKGIVFWGTPARPLREYLKELAYLSRASKQGKPRLGNLIGT